MYNGLRVLKRRRQVDLDLAREYLEVPVANVSDCMNRMFAGGPRLRPMHAGARMSGPAVTVKTRPGDNLMVHKALQLTRPGDVLVVDGGGDLSHALVGEIMLGDAIRQGLAGVVIYGAIRDAAQVAAMSLPVFAAGVTHRGPYKDGPGEINVPIALEGMVIEPGDLMIGDCDGVLCIPYLDARALLAGARQKQEAEADTIAAMEAGTLDRSWVDATLDRLNCFIED